MARRVLLVGEHYDVAVLEDLCARLREAGFSTVRFLRGGVRSWKDAGGSLAGSHTSLADLPMIPPAALARELGRSPWVLLAIDCANGDLPDVLPLEVKHLNVAGKLHTSVAAKTVEILRASTHSDELPSVAVVACGDAPERAYSNFDVALREVQPSYRFYVARGGAELRRFAAQYQAMLAPRLRATGDGGECRP